MPAGRLPGAWPSLRPWTRASRSRGRGASFWFQDMGAPRPERNRVHIGVWVPHDQAAARPAGRGRRPRGRTARARDGGRADRAAGGRAGGPGQQPARQSGRAAAAGRQPAPAQRHAPHARVVGRLGARHPAPDQVAKRPAAQNGHIRGRTLKSARRVPTSESHEQPDVGSGGPGPTCRCGPRGWSWWRSRCWRCCWPRWGSGSRWPRTGGTRGAARLQQNAERLAGGLPLLPALPDGDALGELGRGLERAAVLLGEREQALRDAQALLEHIVAWSPMVMFRGLLGGSGERYISGNVERLLGYTQAQVLGTPGFWTAQLHPEDRDRFTAMLERAIAERAPQLEQDYRFLLQDGYRWLYGVTRFVYDDDGALADTLSYAMDVTERRQADDAIREREATLQAVIKASPDIITILDAGAV